MKELMIVKSINFLLDKILSLDPQKSYLLDRLKQRTLTIQLNDFAMRFCLIPTADNLIFDVADGTHQTNILSADSGVLIAMALSASPQRYIQKAEASFEGDMYVLEAYRDFFKAIHPDLMFTLTQGQTTTLSSLLSKPFDAIKHWWLVSKAQFPIELREYLQYEKELIPCKEELEDFFTDVQQLKQDVERVTARLERYLTAQGVKHE
ncbi:SCP2 sterol-binding domain-containing protein [Caedibacter taeniospiralis]|uniref:SCP2 sterol-binding domain-containing protein n=1 Tax=Caedibacter taeniospiralis TaxID=28907 RepID=UPI000C279148|nr:SCP2 sterol-binding domain-containing protein [Caedibacter taeniospiralis]